MIDGKINTIRVYEDEYLDTVKRAKKYDEMEWDYTNLSEENKRLRRGIENIINNLDEEIKKEIKENGEYGMYYTVELYRQVLKMIEGEIYDS